MSKTYYFLSIFKLRYRVFIASPRLYNKRREKSDDTLRWLSKHLDSWWQPINERPWSNCRKCRLKSEIRIIKHSFNNVSRTKLSLYFSMFPPATPVFTFAQYYEILPIPRHIKSMYTPKWEWEPSQVIK